MIHGLMSCAEWTGVPVSALLDEAGIDTRATWALAEGADASAMTRSIPMDKLLNDAMIALYQNGERIRPEQGYPMRLLLPGWEGNAQVKWLRRLKLTAAPRHSRQETSKYTDTMPDGLSRQFTFVMGVKSVITAPAIGAGLSGPGFYEISGLAWSGDGVVTSVEVSADGGQSWAEAALQGPALPHCAIRFRLPWRWEGGPALLQSRATDDKGNTQPTRSEWAKHYAPGNIYHYNAVQSWRVLADGEIRNVYA
jgi:sulfane dehydrogenase subunit SoxC